MPRDKFDRPIEVPHDGTVAKRDDDAGASRVLVATTAERTATSGAAWCEPERG